MPKRRHYITQKHRQQLFDSSLKGLTAQAPKLIERLFPEVIYLETLTIEIIRPPLRADQVHRVLYRGQPHILHVEYQVKHDPQLQARLLAYCSDLYLRYKLPVLCLVIYPFPTTIARPPLYVMSDGKAMMMLDYHILLLFEENATKYVRRHDVCAYPLLPAMQGVDAQLMEQVGKELKEYYRGQESALRDQFIWMSVFLDRTNTIPDEEKRKIEEVLAMLGLEQLWDESPKVQRERARARAEGLAEGKAEGLAEGLAEGKAKGLAEGSLETSRSLVEMTVNVRFPALTNLAHQKVVAMTQPEALRTLLAQVVVAPDEQTARELLLP
jgi:predicted transposase YdaD